MTGQGGIGQGEEKDVRVEPVPVALRSCVDAILPAIKGVGEYLTLPGEERGEK